MPPIRIVLCRPSHPGNIGAAARAMKAMGLADLRLVAPERFPAKEAQWLATNAVDVLEAATVHATLHEALKDCVAAFALSARPRQPFSLNDKTLCTLNLFATVRRAAAKKSPSARTSRREAVKTF